MTVPLVKIAHTTKHIIKMVDDKWLHDGWMDYLECGHKTHTRQHLEMLKRPTHRPCYKCDEGSR